VNHAKEARVNKSAARKAVISVKLDNYRVPAVFKTCIIHNDTVGQISFCFTYDDKINKITPVEQRRGIGEFQ